MTITQLHPQLSVGRQITLDEIRSLAASGFTDIVCNLPDNEIEDGPLSADVAQAAKVAGLGFHYLPIRPGEHPVEQGQSIAKIVQRPDARVFAYCRSGARSTLAWSIVRPQQNSVPNV
jgi:sulfide:quinone oxidoreductase